MLKITIIVTALWFVACKPLGESHVQTTSDEATTSDLEFLLEWHVRLSSTFSPDELKQLELNLTEAINKNPRQLSSDQLDTLKKMRHKLRSFIISLLTCGKEQDDRLVIDREDLCSLIVSKLQHMNYQTIDIDNVDENFYYDTFLKNKYDINNPSASDKQKLYRELLATIARVNDASMEKYNSIWPFAKINWFGECLKANMHEIRASQRMSPSSLPTVESLQKNANCQQLKGHVPSALPYDEKVLVYHDIGALTDHLRYYVMRLNELRYKINHRLRVKSNDPAVKKQNLLIIPNVFKMTDFGNSDIVRLHEQYYATLIEVAQQRLLPLMLDIYRHKLYLNPKGKWFGFAAIRHNELKYPDEGLVQRAIDKTKRNLVNQYLQIMEARNDEREITDEKLYKNLIYNEIAAAQTILQNPQHALVASQLIHIYQEKFKTPDWLQKLKTWSYRLDFILIPVTLIGGGLANKYAPPLAPVFLNIAIAANLFWIASATADSVVAFKRYQTVERALASGTSINVKEGASRADDLRKKVIGAIVSAGVGGTLSVKALQLSLNKLPWAQRTDLSAALVSEWAAGEGLNVWGSFTEGTTYQEEHNKK